MHCFQKHFTSLILGLLTRNADSGANASSSLFLGKTYRDTCKGDMAGKVSGAQSSTIGATSNRETVRSGTSKQSGRRTEDIGSKEDRGMKENQELRFRNTIQDVGGCSVRLFSRFSKRSKWQIGEVCFAMIKIVSFLSSEKDFDNLRR